MSNTSVRGLDEDARGRCVTDFVGNANPEVIANPLND